MEKPIVVFGSRFAGGEAHRVAYFWHMVGNKGPNLLSNMMTNLNVTDMETRIGFEPEITAKVSKLDVVIYEVGISCYGRTYE